MKNLLDNENYIEDLDYISKSNILWSELENKTILITGATGLIGSAIIDAIMYRNNNFNSNIKVIALSRTEEKIKNGGVDTNGK